MVLQGGFGVARDALGADEFEQCPAVIRVGDFARLDGLPGERKQSVVEQRVVMVADLRLLDLCPNHAQRLGLERLQLALASLLHLLGFGDGCFILAAVDPGDAQKDSRIIFLDAPARTLELPGLDPKFRVGNPGALGQGAPGFCRLDLLSRAHDFRPVFERHRLQALQRKIEMPHRDLWRAAQRRLRRAVHQDVEQRLFLDQSSFDVPTRFGLRHEHIRLGTSARFVLEAAGVNVTMEQRFIGPIEFELQVRVRQPVISPPRTGQQFQFAPAQVRLGSLGLRSRSATSPTVLARDRHFLSHHPLRVRKRGETGRAGPFDIHAETRVLPGARLRNPRLQGFPVRPRGLERRVVAEDLEDDPLNGKLVGPLGGLRLRLRGMEAGKRGGEKCSQKTCDREKCGLCSVLRRG